MCFLGFLPGSALIENETKIIASYGINSGLWGWQCKSSPVAKENCALRCLSPVCYQLIYESEPLEEGEKDLVRSQEYKYCYVQVFAPGKPRWCSRQLLI
ncbi:hypothetical protein BRARA_J01793 [Brassica rapa]|uniref:Uncharacterized protein n=1 Tax=Brassica campestris TaxID=3711 RepID=A0A397XN15_BRACM|nr:hypothetical protein BRARA_J01793 [Brassica rapa]